MNHIYIYKYLLKCSSELGNPAHQWILNKIESALLVKAVRVCWKYYIQAKKAMHSSSRMNFKEGGFSRQNYFFGSLWPTEVNNKEYQSLAFLVFSYDRMNVAIKYCLWLLLLHPAYLLTTGRTFTWTDTWLALLLIDTRADSWVLHRRQWSVVSLFSITLRTIYTSGKLFQNAESWEKCLIATVGEFRPRLQICEFFRGKKTFLILLLIKKNISNPSFSINS